MEVSKRIASVSEVIVPFMAVLYIVAAMVLILVNYDKIPAAFQEGLFFLPSNVASLILMACLVFFVFTTILGWDYCRKE